jgi:hypothetical protein
MSTKYKPVIAFTAPVQFAAAKDDGDDPKGPPTFTSIFYTGGAMDINGWDLPVVVDLAGLTPGNVLVANQYHDATRPVGNFAVANDGRTLVANGTATAATAARDEVVNSAANGYQWQASLEVQPAKGGVETVKKGEKVKVNGQEFEGPLYITRKGTLKGFAFVTHGADDNTSASIAAKAATQKEKEMEPKFKAWVEAMGFDPAELSESQIAGLKANYEGQQTPATPPVKGSLTDVIAQKKAEKERRDSITELAAAACDRHPFSIDAVNDLATKAIDGAWSPERFRLELLEATISDAQPYIGIVKPGNKVTSRVIEAALCVSGNLADVEKKFDDQTLQAAHDQFPHGIGLKDLIITAAKANGYNPRGYTIDMETQRAAFGHHRPVHAAAFSTFSLPNTLAATANKFLREGWNSIDRTALDISAIRPVRDFKTITTISLTGGFQFEKLTADGEIPHATPGELTYTNKADTYGIMFAVTRQDYINDDIGALTAVPRRIGRGGMLKLNDIVWTEFLNNSSFFTAGNNNVNTGVADMTTGGLAATEAIFMAQTDADGKPLGAMPKILLVPTALHASALTLMNSELLIGGSTTVPGTNIWRGRFRVLTSPYLSNSAYTGYSAAAWYMLADPNDIPVIEIAALNGRVEPIVETADTDFNTLGFQYRGYSDVGVNLQEYRGGVRADGGSS